MKWDDEIKFVDTAKLTKIYNLREIKKQYIEEIELELKRLWIKEMGKALREESIDV